MELYVYGMRLRGFSIGCQPMKDLVESREDPTRKYHSILIYSRELTKRELYEYEIDYISTYNEYLRKIQRTY